MLYVLLRVVCWHFKEKRCKVHYQITTRQLYLEHDCEVYGEFYCFTVEERSVRSLQLINVPVVAVNQLL